MAIWSVLGKLGSRCIHMSNRNRRSAPILFTASGGSGYSLRHPLDSGDLENKVLDRKIPKGDRQRLRFARRPLGGSPIGEICKSTYNDLGIIASARFAVEEFNKQKDARLQFVRLSRASDQFMWGTSINYLKIEAVDAADDGVVKVYQAMVAQDVRDTMELRFFGLLVDNGFLLKLIDNRRTTTGTKQIDSRDWLLDKIEVPRKTSRYPLGDSLHMFPLQY